MNTETRTIIERSELYKKIYTIVKKLNLEKTNEDAYDHLSVTYDLENLFKDEMTK